MHIKITSGVMIDGRIARKGDVIPVPQSVARRLLARRKAIVVAHDEIDEPGEARDLGDMTVAELRVLADERGVELANGARKPDIIAALGAQADGV
jgi:hypothetical protein